MAVVIVDFFTGLLRTRALLSGSFKLGTLTWKSLFSLLATFLTGKNNSFVFNLSRDILNWIFCRFYFNYTWRDLLITVCLVPLPVDLSVIISLTIFSCFFTFLMGLFNDMGVVKKSSGKSYDVFALVVKSGDRNLFSCIVWYFGLSSVEIWPLFWKVGNTAWDWFEGKLFLRPRRSFDW